MAARPSGTNWLGLQQAYQRAVIEGRLDSYNKLRWRRSEEFAGWLTQEKLPSLSAAQALTFYRASGGKKSEEFKANSIEAVRDTLDFLLFDSVGLENRFNECASIVGAYNLKGTGKEYVSYILCLRDPGLFAYWGVHSERALRQLGIYPGGFGKGDLGLGYMDLLEALQTVRNTVGLADYRAVDQLAFLLTRKSRSSAGMRSRLDRN